MKTPEELLEEWIQKHAGNTSTAAVTLGVSRRTVERWRVKGPSSCAAALLDQVEYGPAVIGNRWRGLVRSQWKERLRCER